MARAFIPHVITNDSALGGNVIEKSLRFNNYSSSADDAQLYRTVSTTSNRRTYTHSFWVKRTKLGYGMIFGQTDGSGSNFCYFVFNSNNKIEFNEYVYNSGGNKFRLITTRVFRDTTAWYHIVTNVDTTQGSAADRVKIYVNGVQETAFDTGIYPDQNYDTFINWTLYAAMRIGLNGWGYGGANCYLSEFNAVDGYAYDPSYFGYTESQTGLWRPKRYEGTYGTNGYHLKFNDTSNLPLSLGRDASINGNHFQTDNISTSSGTGNDSVTDTPTNNWATMNPLSAIRNSPTFRNGNLEVIGPGSGIGKCGATCGLSSGKWYVEAKIHHTGSNLQLGIINANTNYNNNEYIGSGSDFAIAADCLYARIRKEGSTVQSSLGGMQNTDILGFAIDMDNGSFQLYNNGSTKGSAVSFSVADYAPVTFAQTTGADSSKVEWNFGQQGFTYTPPTGYKAVNSQNLPPNVPSIIRPQRHFDTLLYDGDGSASRDITGLEFRPDMIWIKNRSQASTHSLQDSIIGFGDDKTLRPDTSNALDTNGNLYGYINHTLPNGFNVNGGSEHASSRVNSSSSGAKHVAWCWKGGGTAVSNTDGSITTQVSVNEEAGFSIATYTGNGATTATIGHGLGKTPAWIIIKNRSSSTDWVVMHEGIGSYDGGNYKHQPIKLNSTGAKTSILGIWQTPNSSTQQISDGQTSGSNRPLTNTSGDNYVAYFWAEIPGYSKFGSYTGNGSSDGTFVFLGFRPAWVMVKRTDSSEPWVIMDNKRPGFNPNSKGIYSNSSAAENDASGRYKDFLSNGFKARGTSGEQNSSGGTYIYMAFAERPESTAYDTETNAR